MKAIINTRHGTIEVEADEQDELFEEMASAYEVFDEPRCGLCGSEFIRPVVRKNKANNKFYEYHCMGFVRDQATGKDVPCRAYCQFGNAKKGDHLFPIRQLNELGKPDRENGKWGKHRGWTRYRGEPNKDAAEAKK